MELLFKVLISALLIQFANVSQAAFLPNNARSCVGIRNCRVSLARRIDNPKYPCAYSSCNFGRPISLLRNENCSYVLQAIKGKNPIAFVVLAKMQLTTLRLKLGDR